MKSEPLLTNIQGLQSRMVHDTCKLNKFFKVKGQALLHRSNVVYQVTCTCGKSNIGETERNLVTRLNERNLGSKKYKNTNVDEHLYEYSNHN